MNLNVSAALTFITKPQTVVKFQQKTPFRRNLSLTLFSKLSRTEINLGTVGGVSPAELRKQTSLWLAASSGVSQ